MKNGKKQFKEARDGILMLPKVVDLVQKTYVSIGIIQLML